MLCTRLVEAAQNLLGAVDTPIMRRRFAGTSVPEAVAEAKDLIELHAREVAEGKASGKVLGYGVFTSDGFEKHLFLDEGEAIRKRNELYENGWDCAVMIPLSEHAMI